jgi:hypothetical protein
LGFKGLRVSGNKVLRITFPFMREVTGWIELHNKELYVSPNIKMIKERVMR